VIQDDGGKLVPSCGENLIITRILGHPEIPNGHLWHVDYDNQPYQTPCWICDKHKYTLIFYNKTTQKKEVIKDKKLHNAFKKALFKENPLFQKYMDTKNSPNNEQYKIFLTGSITEWKAVRMIGLSEMIYKLK
jgi:hypothetical protein